MDATNEREAALLGRSWDALVTGDAADGLTDSPAMTTVKRLHVLADESDGPRPEFFRELEASMRTTWSEGGPANGFAATPPMRARPASMLPWHPAGRRIGRVAQAAGLDAVVVAAFAGFALVAREANDGGGASQRAVTTGGTAGACALTPRAVPFPIGGGATEPLIFPYAPGLLTTQAPMLLPRGAAADAETTAAVTRAVRSLADCAGDPAAIATAYSDQYLRRLDASFRVFWVPADPVVEEVRELPYAKVAALVRSRSGQTALLVYVQRLGVWRVDELVLVAEPAEFAELGDCADCVTVPTGDVTPRFSPGAPIVVGAPTTLMPEPGPAGTPVASLAPGTTLVVVTDLSDTTGWIEVTYARTGQGGWVPAAAIVGRQADLPTATIFPATVQPTLTPAVVITMFPTATAIPRLPTVPAVSSATVVLPTYAPGP